MEEGSDTQGEGWEVLGQLVFLKTVFLGQGIPNVQILTLLPGIHAKSFPWGLGGFAEYSVLLSIQTCFLQPALFLSSTGFATADPQVCKVLLPQQQLLDFPRLHHCSCGLARAISGSEKNGVLFPFTSSCNQRVRDNLFFGFSYWFEVAQGPRTIWPTW